MKLQMFTYKMELVDCASHIKSKNHAIEYIEKY